MGMRQAVKDFGRGIQVLRGKSEGEGDRKLARVALVIDEMTTGANKHQVAAKLIKSIEGDFKRYARKGGEAMLDENIERAMGTPEYVALLKRLDMGKANLIVLKREALKKYAK